MREAVNLMSDRLRMRLQRAVTNWAAIRGGKPVPLPHEWRIRACPHRACPTSPAPEEREVIRRKAYMLARQTPDKAVTELELLDYDFYLFTERATGIARIRSWWSPFSLLAVWLLSLPGASPVSPGSSCGPVPSLASQTSSHCTAHDGASRRRWPSVSGGLCLTARPRRPQTGKRERASLPYCRSPCLHDRRHDKD
jgi:hypothetical protein